MRSTALCPLTLGLGLLLSACAREPAPVTTSAAAASWPHGAMVAAANPHAVAAGVRVLEAGGHAVEAAIAAHAVLGLVEPQSSGIGGGAFMLVYDAGSGEVLAYDGRETAPAAASADMFVVDGEALGYLEAWQSGLSVGVPGIPALYADTHARHGRLDLATVLAPAVSLARDGFEVSPRLAGMLARIREVSNLDDNPDTAAYFYPGGEPLPVGFVRTNPAYADTLTRLAADGPDSFYRGALARDIVRAARQAPHPGRLSLEDLAGYRSVRRAALCGDAGDVTLCTMPPPSSGLAQLMILSLYDRLVPDREASPAERWAAFVDAQRLAYADRDHYVGDPDFGAVPAADLIDPRYLEARAGERVAPAATPQPGDPGAVLRDEPLLASWRADSTLALPSTTHVSVVDADGNAVSLTASVEAPFGSSRWAGGFLLNNQLTDFARDPGSPEAPAVNLVLPGKRPRSSMSPTLVFDADGALRMVTGSPGGNSIVAYVAKTVVGVLRWDLSARDAIDLPNVVARGREVRVETGVDGGRRLADALQQRGYPVQEREGENSGLHVIVVRADGLEGAADRRREGRAVAVPP